MDYCRKVSPLEGSKNRNSLLKKLVRLCVCLCVCVCVCVGRMHVCVGRWVMMCVCVCGVCVGGIGGRCMKKRTWVMCVYNYVG